MSGPTDLRLAELAALSYKQFTLSVGDVQILVVQEDGAVVVVVRGTSSPFDWLRGLRFLPWYSWRLGWCHSGFLKGARLVWFKLMERLAEMDGPVYLVGHGMGGAVATDLAAMLLLVGRPPVALVTFGSPRVGAGRLGRILAGIPTRRYVNGSDPVPLVPWLLGFYKHVGKAIELADANVTIVGDHFMSDYIPHLEAHLGLETSRGLQAQEGVVQ